MPGDLPARIDRAAIERIIQRATELQTGERDIGEGMSHEEVVALGKDVGIPERYLRQAILEEQGQVAAPAPTSLLDRAFGAALVSAQRVVTGTADEVQQRLRAYLEREEPLLLQREQPGRVTWEPIGGLQAALRSAAEALGSRKSSMLGNAALVTATITPLEPGYCHVYLTADLGKSRTGYIVGVATTGLVGAATSAVLAVLSPFVWVPLLPVPVVLGIGYLVASQFRPVAARAQLGLERVLDHLERGQVKPAHLLAPGVPGALGAILEEVRKALKP